MLQAVAIVVNLVSYLYYFTLLFVCCIPEPPKERSKNRNHVIHPMFKIIITPTLT